MDTSIIQQIVMTELEIANSTCTCMGAARLWMAGWVPISLPFITEAGLSTLLPTISFF